MPLVEMISGMQALDVTSYNEDEVKQTIILQIFQQLGWNIFNPQEVKPEYSIDGKRVDYALLIRDKPKAFVEIKRPSVPLEGCQEQLLEYAFRFGVRLAVLANGVDWWFYLPSAEGHWTARKYLSINLFAQEAREIARRFTDFLGKTNVESGEAERLATEVFRGEARKAAIAANLPKAWEALIGEPDERLLEILRDRVERMSGYPPSPDELMVFLGNVPDERRDPVIADRVNAAARPDRAGENRAPAVPPQQAIGQREMQEAILRVLRALNGRAPKQKVEENIWRQYETEFKKDWYQEPVAHGLPRWKHNIAWAKEQLKHDGLVMKPAEAGFGMWQLTDAGKAEGWHR